ncbi:hypothetical protein [Actinomadura rupiterrae]|uniref:hypothetical protein n=1 Tax=Actinomadura rupiterrae TaxID=559627 RepID=UPI0020A276D0|nr:hypothetical protein [Actinomadura rupiterrae]MCP2337884.1 hypothetical protein [Actinomadura rupiterrae]
MIELLLLSAGGFAGGMHAVRKNRAHHGGRARRPARTESLLVKAWNSAGAPATEETMLAEALADLGGRAVGRGARGAWTKGKKAKPWAEARWQQREANGGAATFFRRRKPTTSSGSGSTGPALNGTVIFPPGTPGVPGPPKPPGPQPPGPPPTGPASPTPPGGPNGSPSAPAGNRGPRFGTTPPRRGTGRNGSRPVPAAPGGTPATPPGPTPPSPGQAGGGGGAANRPATRREAQRLVPTGRRGNRPARRPQRAQTRMRVLGPLQLEVPDTDVEFLDSADELMQILRGIGVAVEDWTDQVAIRNLPPIVTGPLYAAAEELAEAAFHAAMAAMAFEVWYAEARQVADAGIEFTGDDPA